ncbi:MAG: hypothetical protein K8953_08085, partial [Proteobacteria bacterium]|nr:hypothetical protein [Pseudomonadota bacterium]
TIDLTPFPTGTVVREVGLRFGRRGGRGSIDDDGFVNFRLLKANDDGSVTVPSRSSVHSAILPTTNLGAPLASPPMTALWPGHYHAVNGVVRPANFYITFDTSLNTGAIGLANKAGDGIGAGETRQDVVKGLFLTLTAAFDANGVITGTVSQLGDFLENAPILGLIGTEGLVAAASNSTGAVGFTATNPDGGAVPVLDPCISGTLGCYGKYELWISNARDSVNLNFLPIPIESEPATNNNVYSFIAAGADELNLTDAMNKSVVRLGDLDGNDNNTSGFAIGTLGSAANTRGYVGILSGTSVGAPLTLDANITAEWTGLLSIQRRAVNNKKAITLDIDFEGGTGTIKTKAGGFDYDTTGGQEDPNIVINGKFGANGVIYGTTTSINTDTAVPGAINGTLTGLIGENGAVGMFNGISGPHGYVGGFVVQPE